MEEVNLIISKEEAQDLLSAITTSNLPVKRNLRSIELKLKNILNN
jgi:hypothetical protein